MEQQNLCLPSLDIMINKGPENNSIWIDIFYKKIDTWRCVSFKSCHPTQCKKNILVTLPRRICTILENNKVRRKLFDELQKVLYSHEYPQNLVQEVIPKVTSLESKN